MLKCFIWSDNEYFKKSIKFYSLTLEKIPKNHKERKPSKSYGGQFHFDYTGFKNRNIFGLDGAYGQSILIDMDNSTER